MAADVDTEKKVVLFEAPGGREDLELGAAVDLVGDGALVGGEGVDEVFGQFLTFGEEVVLGVELVVDDLGDGFAIADGGEAVFVDALLDEVVDDGLGTTLGEVEVEGLTTYTVGVQ